MDKDLIEKMMLNQLGFRKFDTLEMGKLCVYIKDKHGFNNPQVAEYIKEQSGKHITRQDVYKYIKATELTEEEQEQVDKADNKNAMVNRIVRAKTRKNPNKVIVQQIEYLMREMKTFIERNKETIKSNDEFKLAFLSLKSEHTRYLESVLK